MGMVTEKQIMSMKLNTFTTIMPRTTQTVLVRTRTVPTLPLDPWLENTLIYPQR
jgi:hypothetical protein